jgi:DNA-binding beta-propeller fold protein YncE
VKNKVKKLKSKNSSTLGLFSLQFLAFTSALCVLPFDLFYLALCLLTCSCLACRRPPPPQPYTAFVVNHQSATLAAVNLANFHVTASLAVAPQPVRVLARPRSRQLYVVSETGKISVVAFPHLHLVTTLEVGTSAKDLVFSPDGFSAYVLSPADHEVVFLDCAAGPRKGTDADTPKVVSRLRPASAGPPPVARAGPTGMVKGYGLATAGRPQSSIGLRMADAVSDLALSPDGKTLVTTVPTLNQLIFISAETRKLLGTVDVGLSPGALAILPDSSKVFVADEGEEKISAADVASRRLFSHIEMGARPTALLVKPDGGELFVLAAPTSTLIIVDAFHDNVEQTFPLGRDPVAGIFRKDMSVLYIANAGDGSVLSLDVRNRVVLASTHVGMEPRALALTPDERFLVVADSGASSLAVLHADLASLSSSRSLLITAVTVGKTPVDVVVPDYLNVD